MNDRLIFRAYFENLCLYTSEGEKYYKSFMLECVVLFYNREVGCYREDFEEQLTKQGFDEYEKEQIIDDYEISMSGDDLEDWVNFKADYVEQSTGLKDKYGTRIFEGDIIKKPYNDFYEYALHVISWENGAYTTKRCLAIKDNKSGALKDCSNGGFCFSTHITQELADSFEVIGNIHQNKNMLTFETLESALNNE